MLKMILDQLIKYYLIKKKQIKALQDKMKTVDRVLLASDEDREGEAMKIKHY